MIQFILWYLVITAIGFCVFPLASNLLPSLKDRGYAFSRVLGLMLGGFIFWLLVSYRILQNDFGGILMAILLTFVIGFLVSKKSPVSELKELVGKQKGYLVTVELLFLILFALLALLRAANPDITGTEKPMELAFINSILRSPTFPPADPWLAGYSISYYYFGYVITAMLVKLTGTPSGIGFNLMISLVFALTGIGLYGLVYNIINSDGVQKWIDIKKGDKAKKVSGTSQYLLPLFGPLFTLLVSNFEGVFEFLHSKGLFWTVGSDGTFQSTFWKWLDIQELTQAPLQPFTWWPNRPGGIIWWRASRVLSDYSLQGNWLEIIDEFPFFSFLLADLHPHVLALPFATLMLAIALSVLIPHEEKKFDLWGLEFHLPVMNIIFFTVLIGGMAFLNTWDFPVYLVIFLAAYFLKMMHATGFTWDKVWQTISLGIVMVVSSIILYLPFYTAFSSQAGGIIPSMIFSTRGTHFWMMFGTLIIPILIFLIFIVFRKNKTGNLFRGSIISLGFLVLVAIIGLGLGSIAANAGSLTALFPGALGYKLSEAGIQFLSIQGVTSQTSGQLLGAAITRRLTSPGTWITLFVLGSLVAAILLSRKKELELSEGHRNWDTELPAEVVFTLLIILAGVFLTLAPEFVYLRDQFGWRMNTIFKFYYQAWMLWSLAAGIGVAILLRSVNNLSTILAKGLIALTIMAGLCYPVIGIAYTTNYLKPVNGLNLDGNSYLARYNPDELNAIYFLSNAPYGYVMEAVGGSYSSYARIATLSGLPGILGWPPHESQWRGGAKEMGNRESDIQRFYTTSDWQEAKSILDAYRVKYVYVGDLERSTYNLEETKISKNLTPVFQNQTVTIYSYNGN